MKYDLVMTMAEVLAWRNYGYRVYISPTMKSALVAKYISSKLYYRDGWNLVRISDYNTGGR